MLRLVAVGASTGQIARELSISKRSVRLHAERVREKTGARSRAELAALAVRDGFLPMAEDEPGRPPLRPER